jgi:DNA mismatch repair ATPase MutS
MVDAPVVMAAVSQIVEGARSIGVAYVDIAGRRLGAAQFDDDDLLSTLGRVIVQLGARECVVPQARCQFHALHLLVVCRYNLGHAVLSFGQQKRGAAH